MSVRIAHHPDENRFVALNERAHPAVQVGELTYHRADGRVVFDHTGVSPEYQGQGIAGELARAALEWAGLEVAEGRAAGVTPACSYVAAVLRRHPEYVGAASEPTNPS